MKTIPPHSKTRKDTRRHIYLVLREQEAVVTAASLWTCTWQTAVEEERVCSEQICMARVGRELRLQRLCCSCNWCWRNRCWIGRELLRSTGNARWKYWQYWHATWQILLQAVLYYKLIILKSPQVSVCFNKICLQCKKELHDLWFCTETM